MTPEPAGFLNGAQVLDQELEAVVDPLRLLGRIHRLEDRLRELELSRNPSSPVAGRRP